MTYSEFLDAVLSFVRKNLPEGYTCDLHSVVKNNDTLLDALTVVPTGAILAPTLYLNGYYERYCAGEDFGHILDQVLATASDPCPEASFDLTQFTDYEKAKGRIVCRLINHERNRIFLRDVPHVEFLDLSIIFYCLLSEDVSGSATVVIHERHRESWHVTTDDLLAAARQNTKRLLSVQLDDLQTLLLRLTKTTSDFSGPMYVLTNRLRLHGASALLDTDFLNDFAKSNRSGFYVLPSSIHEVLLLPSEETFTAPLRHIVRDINRSVLSKDEVLSDEVYYFDPEADRLRLACA